MSEPTRVTWRKSSFSNGGGNCVELACTPNDHRAVRDSKDPEQGTLLLTRSQLTAFFGQVRAAG